jgi:hypothetical protein
MTCPLLGGLTGAQSTLNQTFGGGSSLLTQSSRNSRFKCTADSFVFRTRVQEYGQVHASNRGAIPMTRSSQAVSMQRKIVSKCAALALACCVSWLSMGTALAVSPDAAITLISMEKDCFGCSAGERLVLRRDGQASLTLTGKARHGTQDQTSLGVVGDADFDALARLTLAQGFLALQEVYDDPQTRDGGWTIISIERSGGDAKQVFRRAGAGPAALDVIEAALQAQRGRIAFKRKHP